MAVSREIDRWKEWDEVDILEKGALEMGVDLDTEISQNLLKYLHEILKWNKKINLIGPGSIPEQIVVHLVDALCLLAHLDTDAARFADIGSGGGIPGIVLKIARPQWTGLLIEARSKRAGFLRHVIRQGALEGVAVHEGRLSLDVCQGMGHPFDLVTMRGFASIQDSIGLAAPLMAPQGRLAAYKGPHYQEELEQAGHLMMELGLSVDLAAEYELPFLSRKRSLVIFRKEG